MLAIEAEETYSEASPIQKTPTRTLQAIKDKAITAHPNNIRVLHMYTEKESNENLYCLLKVSYPKSELLAVGIQMPSACAFKLQQCRSLKYF